MKDEEKWVFTILVPAVKLHKFSALPLLSFRRKAKFLTWKWREHMIFLFPSLSFEKQAKTMTRNICSSPWVVFYNPNWLLWVVIFSLAIIKSK